jgi:hypothetical protein
VNAGRVYFNPLGNQLNTTSIPSGAINAASYGNTIIALIEGASNYVQAQLVEVAQ